MARRSVQVFHVVDALEHGVGVLVERGDVRVAGGSTEGCVVQSGIHARELGYKVTILTAACTTADEQRERTALAYAESVAGILLG